MRKQGKKTLKEVRGRGGADGKREMDLMEKTYPKCTALQQLCI